MADSIEVSRTSFKATASDGLSGPLSRFDIRARFVAWSDEVGPIVLATTKALYTPIVTGALAASEYYTRQTLTSGVDMRIASHLPQAAYVTKGTRPHSIDAKPGKVLHWENASGHHFSKHVNHPGNAANDFGKEAADATRAFWSERFTAIVGGDLK